MAKVKQPLFSLDARRKLGDDIVFKSQGRTAIVETRPMPKDARSVGQLSWRHMFLKVVALWHALSAAEKEAWESLARPRHMTGYAWFVSQALRPNPGIYLPLQGGTMQGIIDMAGEHIHGLPAPVHVQDPLRRQDYVDYIQPFLHAKYTNAEAIAAAKTVKLDDFATPNDNTDLNASITRHGLLKKLSNVATQFMNGVGGWSEPAGEDATKEFYAPFTNGTDPTPGSPGIQVDASSDNAYAMFYVPHDFSSITEVVAVRRSKATATHRLNYVSAYGAQGEAYNTHTGSLMDVDTAETNFVNYEEDISGMLSSLAAGDYVIIRVYGDVVNTPDDYIRGIRLKYS